MDPVYPVLKEVNKRLKNLRRCQISNEPRLILFGDFGWFYNFHVASLLNVDWHHKACHHCVAFMDGHADFLKIRKGLYVTPDYVVMPFGDLLAETADRQVERPCE